MATPSEDCMSLVGIGERQEVEEPGFYGSPSLGSRARPLWYPRTSSSSLRLPDCRQTPGSVSLFGSMLVSGSTYLGLSVMPDTLIFLVKALGYFAFIFFKDTSCV